MEITSKPAAQVSGTSSIHMVYFVINLVLSYPICRLLPTFVTRRFPSTPAVAPPPPIPLVGFRFSPTTVAPSPPFIFLVPQRFSAIEVHPKLSETPHLKRSIPLQEN